MNYPLLTKVLAWVFVVLAIAFGSCFAMAWFLPGAVSELTAIKVYAVMIAFCTCTAIVLFYAGRNAVMRIYRKEALCIVGSGWILASLVGSQPYYWILSDCDLTAALFESTSGLSTTGASVFTEFNNWPKSLLFWRQLSQWIGGLGVVVLFVTILSLVGAGSRILFAQENSTGQQDMTYGSIRRAIHRLFFLYIALSIACFIGYYATELDWFEALTHMMSTVSTAGFSIHPKSLDGYDNFYVELVAMIFMTLSGITFLSLLKLRRDPLLLWKSPEIRTYLLVILVGSLLGAGYLYYFQNEDSFLNALREFSFQTISLITTTGLTSVDFTQWYPIPLIFLLACMIVGGCSGSTAGGLKIIRLILLLKVGRNTIEHSFRPRLYRPILLQGKVVNQQVLENLKTYVLLLILIIGFSILFLPILQFRPTGLETQISAVLTCLFNVGPGLGEIGPSGDFSIFTPPAKILLCLLMIMGRLELFAILALFFPSLWKQFQ
jgi:trk system potassium uptake protein TrkH